MFAGLVVGRAILRATLTASHGRPGQQSERAQERPFHRPFRGGFSIYCDQAVGSRSQRCLRNSSNREAGRGPAMLAAKLAST
jgi:hypothetical protein